MDAFNYIEYLLAAHRMFFGDCFRNHDSGAADSPDASGIRYQSRAVRRYYGVKPDDRPSDTAFRAGTVRAGEGEQNIDRTALGGAAPVDRGASGGASPHYFRESDYLVAPFGAWHDVTLSGKKK